MATGKRYYWLKLRETFLTSDAVDFLMSQENGANYVVLYQMICLKTINTDGRLAREIGEIIIPYDEAKISRDCKWFSIDTVRVALNLYKALGLVYQDDDGVLVLANHKEMVGSETDYAAQKRRQIEKKETQPQLPPMESGVEILHTDIRDKILDSNNISTSYEVDSPKQSFGCAPEKKKRKKEPIPHNHNAYKAADWLAKKIKERLPNRKDYTEKDLQNWASDIEKLNRIDGYSWDLIGDMLRFSQSDNFWQGNILSGNALRRSFEKLMAQEARIVNDERYT